MENVTICKTLDECRDIFNLSFTNKATDSSGHQSLVFLQNLYKQIESYKVENSELRLFQKNSESIINNLVFENQALRQALFQKGSYKTLEAKYINIVKALEKNVERYKNAYGLNCKQREELVLEIKTLKEKIQDCYDVIAKLEKDSMQVQEVHSKLKESMEKKNELETALKSTESFLKDSTDREKFALQKVHEALYIAEQAVHDKKEAEKSMILLRDECNCLAKTIGNVMDDAAEKVDQDIHDLQKRFLEREEYLIDCQNKLQNDLNVQKNMRLRFEKAYAITQQQNNEVIEQNGTLMKELQKYKNQLVKFILKLNEQNKLMCDDVAEREKSSEDRLQAYIDANKILKEKYKEALSDITIEFKEQIQVLQDQNLNLK